MIRVGFVTNLKWVMLTSITIASSANAAGLEYSRQSIAPLLETGNYAEITYAYVDAEIEGVDAYGSKIEDMMDDIKLPSAAIKVMPTPDTALALLYDRPFGVDTIYQAGSVFSNDTGTTEARIKAEGLTLLGGGKVMDDGRNNVWLYGGIEYQMLEGNVTGADKLGIDAALAGAQVTQQQYDQLAQGNNAGVLTPTQKTAFDTINAVANSDTYYEVDFEDDSALVPVVGMAFERPEIALRAALTYRAKAKYSLTSKERITSIAGTTPYQSGSVDVEMPQSVNLDFQTGLSEQYQLLGMINARWVNWSDFEVNPPLSALLTQEPLAMYGKDAYSVEVALGKQITPRFAGEVRMGYDSGTGEPISLLGPYDAFRTLGLSGEYQLTDNLEIGAGGQYIWFDGGDVKTKLGGKVASVDDGTGYAVGVKIGYHF